MFWKKKKDKTYFEFTFDADKETIGISYGYDDSSDFLTFAFSTLTFEGLALLGNKMKSDADPLAQMVNEQVQIMYMKRIEDKKGEMMTVSPNAPLIHPTEVFKKLLNNGDNQ